MKWSSNCISWNALKEKLHSVSFPLERRTLYFSSCRNRESKVKLWSAGARERKERAFFVPFTLSKGSFFNICVLSQCIVYWISFQNIHTFTYQKTLLNTFFCLLLKSSKSSVYPWPYSRWAFSGLLTDEGGEGSLSLKSVTHILQRWNLAQLYLSERRPKNIWITWHTSWVLLTSAFFHRKSANFTTSKNTDIDCILINNC